MRTHLVYIVILILLTISCKREIDIDIKDKAPVLVVDANLYTDSLVKIYLSWTQNIKDNGPKKVEENAVIELFDADTVIIDVLQNKGDGIYQTGFYKPIPGTLYRFKISSAGKTYWANELMPDTLKCIIQDTSRIIFQGKQNFFQISLKLSHDVAIENYYGLRLKRYFDVINGVDTQHLSEWLKMESIDFVLTEDPQTRFSNQHLVFSDRFFIGSNQILRFGAADLFKQSAQNTIAIELYVSSYSLNGYNFYTSLNEHVFYQNDPFAQPTLIRGNVDDAYGGIVGEFTKRFYFKF